MDRPPSESAPSTQLPDCDVSSQVLQAQHALDDAKRTHVERQLPDSSFGEAAESINNTTQMASDSGGLDILLDGVNSLSESLPALVKVLDAISKVHPYIAIAVGAFRVVIELEVKRRDNDKKVNLLFLEMKNMMSVLLQLQTVRPNHVGGDGITVGARLEGHVKDAASDIKECANACDTYMRKRTLVKVLKGAIWDETLKGYVQTFANRKNAFVLALSMHTGFGIDRANVQLDELMARMDLLIEFFQKTAPYEQRALRNIIQKAGGVEKALQQTETIQELLERERSVEDITQSYRGPAARSAGYYQRPRRSARARSPGHRHSYYPPSPSLRATYGDDPYHPYAPTGIEDPAAAKLRMLKQDLADSPAVAMRKNLQLFERKFQMQQREIMEEMKKIVVHEGDRVISSVLAGPHERIIDPVLYEIWKDMRWRGIVKARHLVLALHDYYMQKLEDQERDMQLNPSAPPQISEEDAWTFKYLGLEQLQRIIEALDDDASGYITIQELNRFTTSRPKGWSLLHWLAYWAVGWQLSMTEYKRKIHNLLECMRKSVETVRAPNRPFLSQYLSTVITLVDGMATNFQGNAENIALLPRFKAYVAQEEAQLRENLGIAKYDIDALDTLALVNGRKGLEKNLYVVVYLMLLRHLEIVRAAHIVILHPEEFSDAEASMTVIEDGFDLRRSLLSTLFQQRRLLVHEEIEDFACGIFSSAIVIIQPNDRLSGPVGDPDEFDIGTVQPPFTASLKYPPHYDEFYSANDDGFADQTDSDNAPESLKQILGPWTGLIDVEFQGAPLLSILHVVFHTSSTTSNQVVAAPLLFQPWACTHVEIVVDRPRDGDDGRIYFVTLKTNASRCLPIYMRLRLSEDGSTLAGHSGATPDFELPAGPGISSETSTPVLFKRNSSPEVMAFYPSPAERETGQNRALWRFAISAVLYRVRQRNCSWDFLRSRRDRRHRLVSVLYYDANRDSVSRQSESPVADECRRLLERALPADLHFAGYASDPTRYSWIIPPCMGREEKCQFPGLLDTVVPCVRCITCSPSSPYPGYGCVFCGLTDCLNEHRLYEIASDPSRGHCIVKTRALGWTTDASEQTMKESTVDRRDRARTIRRMVIQEEGSADRGSDEGRGRDFKPSPLRQSEDVKGSRDEGDTGDGDARQDTMDSSIRKHSGSSSSTDQTTVDDHSRPLCIACREKVTLPCWTCAECEELLAICDACDEQGGVNQGTHKATHTLLRVFTEGSSRSRPPPSPVSVYPQRRRRRSRSPQVIAMVDVPPTVVNMGGSMVPGAQGVSEQRLEAVEERLAKIEGRFEAVESGVARMERMLAAAIAALNVSSTT